MIFKQNIPVKSRELHSGTSSLDTRTRKGLVLINMLLFFSHALSNNILPNI